MGMNPTRGTYLCLDFNSISFCFSSQGLHLSFSFCLQHNLATQKMIHIIEYLTLVLLYLPGLSQYWYWYWANIDNIEDSILVLLYLFGLSLCNLFQAILFCFGWLLHLQVELFIICHICITVIVIKYLSLLSFIISNLFFCLTWWYLLTLESSSFSFFMISCCWILISCCLSTTCTWASPQLQRGNISWRSCKTTSYLILSHLISLISSHLILSRKSHLHLLLLDPGLHLACLEPIRHLCLSLRSVHLQAEYSLMVQAEFSFNIHWWPHHLPFQYSLMIRTLVSFKASPQYHKLPSSTQSLSWHEQSPCHLKVSPELMSILIFWKKKDLFACIFCSYQKWRFVACIFCSLAFASAMVESLLASASPTTASFFT